MSMRTAMLTLSLLWMSSQAVKAVPFTYQHWTPYGYELGGISKTNLSHATYLILIHAHGISSEGWWKTHSADSQNTQQGNTKFLVTDYPNENRNMTGHYHVQINNSLGHMQKTVSLEMNMNPYGSFSLKYRFLVEHNLKKNNLQSHELLEISMYFTPYHRWWISIYHKLSLVGLTHTTNEQRSFQGTESERWMIEGYPYRYILASGYHQLTFSGTIHTKTEQRTLQGTQFMGLSMLFDWSGRSMISGNTYLHGEIHSPQQQQFLQESLRGSMRFEPTHFSAQYNLDIEGLNHTQEEQRHLKGYESQGLSRYFSPWGEDWVGGHHHFNLLGQVRNSACQRTLTGQHHEVWSVPSNPLMPPIFLASRENGITLW